MPKLHPDRDRFHLPQHRRSHRRNMKFEFPIVIQDCRTCPLLGLKEVESKELLLSDICDCYTTKRQGCGYLRSCFGDLLREIKDSYPKAFKRKFELCLECCVAYVHLRHSDLLVRVHGLTDKDGHGTKVARERAEYQKMFLMIFRSVEGPPARPKVEKGSRFDPELLGALETDNGQE